MKCSRELLSRIVATMIVVVSLCLFVKQTVTCLEKFIREDTATTIDIVR